jgi:hypothetical protein
MLDYVVSIRTVDGFLFFPRNMFFFIQAKAQKALVLETIGHTERDTSWDRGAKGWHDLYFTGCIV